MRNIPLVAKEGVETVMQAATASVNALRVNFIEVISSA
jgi:hypothetical protein